MVKLTELSSLGGFACDISQKILLEIESEKFKRRATDNTNYLFGHKLVERVYETDGNKGILSTCHFLTPIVDNPYNFGQIAAANAFNEIYAMGGKPIMAKTILCWPAEYINRDSIKQILLGASEICESINIVIRVGKTLKTIKDLIFGLSVTGLLNIPKIVHPNTPKTQAIIYLTKPLGTGVHIAAVKKGLLNENSCNFQMAVKNMSTVNSLGIEVASLVSATNIVGESGLLWHLLEMCHETVQARVSLKSIPLLPDIHNYITSDCQTEICDTIYSLLSSHIQRRGGNIEYGMQHKTHVKKFLETEINLLCDPQISGGLLCAVDPKFKQQFERIALSHNNNIKVVCIGHFEERNNKEVSISVYD